MSEVVGAYFIAVLLVAAVFVVAFLVGYTLRGASYRTRHLLNLIAMVVLVGALRLPTVLAVLCLVPVSSAIAFFAGKTPTTGKLNGGG